MLRVVSLVPSVTETLLAWGVDVVACTRFCEQPQLRHVGGTKDPDIEAIVGLAPDLVVLDREENRLPDAEALEARGVRLHITHVTGLADVGPTLGSLAAAVGVDVPEVAFAEPVEHHQIGREVDDRGDVGVLGAADVAQLRLLAEPGAGDDVDAPGEQRLGDRWDEADDPQRLAAELTGRATCASAPGTPRVSACRAGACPRAAPTRR